MHTAFDAFYLLKGLGFLALGVAIVGMCLSRRRW